jgi:hypothetical protein
VLTRFTHCATERRLLDVEGVARRDSEYAPTACGEAIGVDETHRNAISVTVVPLVG